MLADTLERCSKRADAVMEEILKKIEDDAKMESPYSKNPLDDIMDEDDDENDDYDGPDPCELEKTASWRFGSREDYMEADMEGQI